LKSSALDLIWHCCSNSADNYVSKRKLLYRGLGKEAIRAKLADTDVFLLPSRYEGMSNAALEAMELGCRYC